MTDTPESTIRLDIEISEKDYEMLGSICRFGDPNVTDPWSIPIIRNKILHDWIFQKFITIVGTLYRCRCKRDADIPAESYFYCENNCGDEDRGICDMIQMKQGFNRKFPSHQERVSDEIYKKRRQFICDREFRKPYPCNLFYLISHDGIEQIVTSETVRFETYIGMKGWEAFVNAVVNLIRQGFLEWNGPCLKVSAQGANEIVCRVCSAEIKVPLYKELA
jgi:hypothetical protein